MAMYLASFYQARTTESAKESA